MDPISVPWAALVTLGSAVSAVIVALWAKLRQIEAQRDDWISRWAREVRRYPEDSDFEEKTDVRTLRDRILREPDIRAILREYVQGKSDPPKR